MNDPGNGRPSAVGAVQSRREFILGASAFVLPLLAGCGLRTEDPETTALTVGICDALCRQTASACVGEYAGREYAGLSAAVRRVTGVQLNFEYFKLDQLLIEAVRLGRVDAMICKAWTAHRAAHAAGRPFERLADVPAPTGRRLLRGVFIVRADSSLRTLHDIVGRSFALGTDTQYESSVQARQALSLAGVRPGEMSTQESCLNTAALVWERQADAGVVSDYCADHSGLQLVGDPDAFRIIGRTAGVPFITFAVSHRVPRSVRARLKRCLLSLDGRVPDDLDTTALIEPVPWRPEGGIQA